MLGFDYPANALSRKHGPSGYLNYEPFRAWLRDEFLFRCIYCLQREQWGTFVGGFAIDHFAPQALAPSLVSSYDNLIYSCQRCNLIKKAQVVPDPLRFLIGGNLRVTLDGNLEWNSKEAESLILKLDLNAPTMVAWRKTFSSVIELAKAHDSDLYRRLMGFPDELPNLRRKQPSSNTRPHGVDDCCFERRANGTLPDIY